MRTQYYCRRPGRVAALRAQGASPGPLLNGIEYLEVEPGETRLSVHFVHPLADTPAQPLQAGNVEIRGGVRVRDPKVLQVDAADDVLTVDVATPGDFSRYVLRLVRSASGGGAPAGIDPALAEIEFSFKVDCPSEFDCQVETECAPAIAAEPPLDYLAKDYTSFRRSMLDRVTALIPDWRERSPADLWVTLVELVAFRADELSYFQDAVACEAYLGTARRRVSVRRHARLLDYPFHDGCNARVWVALAVGAGNPDGQLLRGCDAAGLGGALFLTRIADPKRPIAADRVEDAFDAGAEAFEALHDLMLWRAHDEIRFYTWSDEECCLAAGATRAFLRNDAGELQLEKGHVLAFVERRSAVSGSEADADRTHRHAVRLTDVRDVQDELEGIRAVEVEWHADDALPFPLCISKRIGGKLEADLSVALGNVVLADHGRTVSDPEATVQDGGSYRLAVLRTRELPLTQQVHVRSGEVLLRVDRSAPAAAALRGRLDDLRPAIELHDSSRRPWSARRDLLASGRFDAGFVVETEDDGRSYLRFGDGTNGERPQPGDRFTARYRIGNGRAGNIGAEAIAHLVSSAAGPPPAVERVWNPMPAVGGEDPHPIEQARLYAPQAFRRQERAVTPEDYAAAAQRHPGVQRAAATRRWTGSWHTVFLTVDRRGGALVDAAFERELRAFLERFRLAGHDLEIDAPRSVPLDIALEICVKPGYFAEHVKQRLLDELGAGSLVGGRSGLFHPDNFTFGTPVHLSAIVARAMGVPGVAHLVATRFQRFGRTASSELDDGRIEIGRLEIARLDNDPNAPENGRMELRMEANA